MQLLFQRQSQVVLSPTIAHLSMLLIANSIGVNRPDLGGTVLNSATVSCRPALLAFNPDFT